MEYVATQKALAEAMGLTQGRVSQLKRERWWPDKEPGKGWPVEACIDALETNRRRDPVNGQNVTPRRSARRADPSKPLAPLPSISPDEHPVEIAKAAVGVAWAVLQREAEAGTADVRDIDALKKALSELRMVEAAYLKLAEDRGELVQRDVAAEVAGFLGQRCVEALGDIRARLAPQVAIWLADEAFRGLPEQEQQLQVRQWIDQRTHAVRESVARSLEELIEEAG